MKLDIEKQGSITAILVRRISAAVIPAKTPVPG